MAKHIGTVIQVMGPVLDIRFEDGQLPELLKHFLDRFLILRKEFP